MKTKYVVSASLLVLACATALFLLFPSPIGVTKAIFSQLEIGGGGRRFFGLELGSRVLLGDSGNAVAERNKSFGVIPVRIHAISTASTIDSVEMIFSQYEIDHTWRSMVIGQGFEKSFHDALRQKMSELIPADKLRGYTGRDAMGYHRSGLFATLNDLGDTLLLERFESNDSSGSRLALCGRSRYSEIIESRSRWMEYLLDEK